MDIASRLFDLSKTMRKAGLAREADSLEVMAADMVNDMIRKLQELLEY